MIDRQSSDLAARTPVISTIWTWLAVVILLHHCGLADAQELEPRAYANTPVGMKFLVAGYGYNQGGMLFDPAVRIDGAEASMDVGLVAYAQGFSVGGNSAKFAVATPFAAMDASGSVSGTFQQRQVTGFADPTIAVSINFFGAPALSLPEFRDYRQDTIVGATLKVTVPVGQYDDNRVINIGTNRWSVKPEIGVSHALGRWIVEGAAAVAWYETNHDFYGGKTLQQDLIYSAQGHLSYSFRSGMWVAVDGTYFAGGQSSTNGVPSDNELNNWRVGLTIAAPVSVHHSIKFAASRGISTRTGTNFDMYLLAWQVRWGGGL